MSKSKKNVQQKRRKKLKRREKLEARRNNEAAAPQVPKLRLPKHNSFTKKKYLRKELENVKKGIDKDTEEIKEMLNSVKVFGYAIKHLLLKYTNGDDSKYDEFFAKYGFPTLEDIVSIVRSLYGYYTMLQQFSVKITNIRTGKFKCDIEEFLTAYYALTSEYAVSMMSVIEISNMFSESLGKMDDFLNEEDQTTVADILKTPADVLDEKEQAEKDSE
jgi:hypothetical protein